MNNHANTATTSPSLMEDIDAHMTHMTVVKASKTSNTTLHGTHDSPFSELLEQMPVSAVTTTAFPFVEHIPVSSIVNGKRCYSHVVEDTYSSDCFSGNDVGVAVVVTNINNHNSKKRTKYSHCIRSNNVAVGKENNRTVGRRSSMSSGKNSKQPTELIVHHNRTVAFNAEPEIIPYHSVYTSSDDSSLDYYSKADIATMRDQAKSDLDSLSLNDCRNNNNDNSIGEAVVATVSPQINAVHACYQNARVIASQHDTIIDEMVNTLAKTLASNYDGSEKLATLRGLERRSSQAQYLARQVSILACRTEVFLAQSRNNLSSSAVIPPLCLCTTSSISSTGSSASGICDEQLQAMADVYKKQSRVAVVFARVLGQVDSMLVKQVTN